ncbi:ATP-dependent RNA helicase DHX29-like isoform X1 [Hibiscus syriacus]|uniref:ATP-dependent RNA helicase DHX29-like isoform X1 n=1 Tax=Hibiscus syriacus TaxID=106335 RepID=A0A6A3CDI0_HIBSY|nr:WEB family protein At3g51220-like [Hibiscus syriacus]KAE8727243.1 ATP-dependent RNA helicase DHX29-like isoform X1 [Hibiscus syriacus]
METQVPVPAATKPPKDYRSNVDTSRPFRTVKEAVAVFGERFLVGEIYTPKPYTYSRPPSQEIAWFSPGSTPMSRKQDDQREVLDTLKKLETELEETKVELKLLKERESETEVALALLNAELHKNMSKLAIAEAAAAKKAAETTPTPMRRTASLEMGKGEDIAREEERRKELMKRIENNPTLSQILSIGEKEGYFAGKRERKLMKKKPIVPLVGDWIFKKKGSPTTLHNPLYAS